MSEHGVPAAFPLRELAAASADAQGSVEDRWIASDICDEMEGAFLEYAYSVIYSRALPDARDGLKPVQRRILYSMHELGLRPDKGHVKCSRVVGEVMGKYHPHGDTAIYDAMVRMAQPFTMRLPLVDGHGNFGSLDDGPAASRYTEARMAPAALLMTASLDEDTVDFVPNYDDQLTQPEVLPAAFPNLLVNGASGIAVGMATNMPPHNLVEVIGAARHLIAHPEADLEALMRFVPAPDLPLGGRIIGLDGIREAYQTGRGSFRTRATARIENVTPRKKGIVVTDLPYLVGPEKVIEKVKQLVQSKKLQGISDIIDLTDRTKGLHLVIEIKTGFNPEAVLEQLYRLTPMEESFGINNVALVDGQPRTLGLRELLQVYVDFRTSVVRRRTEHRLRKRQDRLHLVEGLLVAILDIDEVIQLIRSSDDTATARQRLMQVFGLSQLQADYILELQLRQLTKFSRIELESERDELLREIARLQAMLDDPQLLLTVVSDELAKVAKEHGTPRRTVLLESDGNTGMTSAAAPGARGAAAPGAKGAALEVPDDPCWVLLSSTGLLARTTGAEPLETGGRRAKHDVITSRVRTTAQGQVGLVTSAGRVVKLSVVELPSMPPTAGAPSLSGGAPLSAFVDLPPGESVLALASLDGGGPGLALGTWQGVVKRVKPDYPGNRDAFEVISLKEGDRVVGAVELATGEESLVFITSDAQLLHYSASLVRFQELSGGGLAGVMLSPGAWVVGFSAVDPAAQNVVVTVAGSAGAQLGVEAGSVKVTDMWVYPSKGRATGGVRCHRFLRDENALLLAWAEAAPPRAASTDGMPVDLPETNDKRDGSGVAIQTRVAALGTTQGTHSQAGALVSPPSFQPTSIPLRDTGADRGDMPGASQVTSAEDNPMVRSTGPTPREVFGRQSARTGAPQRSNPAFEGGGAAASRSSDPVADMWSAILAAHPHHVTLGRRGPLGESGAFGQAGALYTLDMPNKQITIALARNLRLAAFTMEDTLENVRLDRSAAIWVPGPEQLVRQSSPILLAPRSALRAGRPLIVRGRADWAKIPRVAGIYRILRHTSGVTEIYIGRTSDFRRRPYRHEKTLGRSWGTSLDDVVQIECIPVKPIRQMMLWTVVDLDQAEADHIERARRREVAGGPRVINVTAGRNGPPSSPPSRALVWTATE
ncbi:hypothetical protein GCM10011509_10670 [Ornithinimicrobium pekingense]|uniref:Topo IIA-type catalytic domain-containing protein n=1 Tax=Ornithinimicrobium pekingense TaxID=384677 RepID=A0ABQ2F627_9MICO|nr:hypothetical protein GCM10011509_10670 [Ornithinimicrobium pekingense]